MDRKVELDITLSILNEVEILKSEHRDEVCCIWVVVLSHVRAKFWDHISELDSVDVDVIGNVVADIVKNLLVNVVFTTK